MILATNEADTRSRCAGGFRCASSAAEFNSLLKSSEDNIA